MVATFMIGQFDIGFYPAYLVSTRVAASARTSMTSSILRICGRLKEPVKKHSDFIGFPTGSLI